jgi:hypothetical protein
MDQGRALCQRLKRSSSTSATVPVPARKRTRNLADSTHSGMQTGALCGEDSLGAHDDSIDVKNPFSGSQELSFCRKLPQRERQLVKLEGETLEAKPVVGGENADGIDEDTLQDVILAKSCSSLKSESLCTFALGRIQQQATPSMVVQQVPASFICRQVLHPCGPAPRRSDIVHHTGRHDPVAIRGGWKQVPSCVRQESTRHRKFAPSIESRFLWFAARDTLPADDQLGQNGGSMGSNLHSRTAHSTHVCHWSPHTPADRPR